MKTNECKQFNTKEADTLQTTELSKTSRKPKNTKKTIFQDSCKSKNAKIQKTSRKPKKPKKLKKTNIPGLLQK